MQSSKLAAGTGVLQANTSDNTDLEAVDEILSQHSNPRSCAATVASQADSPAMSIPNPPFPSAINSHRHKLSANDGHALAPAGAYEQAASPVIDLSDSSTPAKHANAIVQSTPRSHSKYLKANSLQFEANISHARTAVHLPEETSNRSVGCICGLGLNCCCCLEHGMPCLQAQTMASACQHANIISDPAQDNSLVAKHQLSHCTSTLTILVNTTLYQPTGYCGTVAMTAACSSLHGLYFSPDAGPAIFCRGGVAGPSHNPSPSPVGPRTESVRIPDSKVAHRHPFLT